MPACSSTTPSVAQLISLTLGLVGVGACATDTVTNTNTNTTTTNASVGEGTESESESESGTEQGSESTHDPTYDPTYEDPCAGWDPDPVVEQIMVTDWVMTSTTYETMREVVEQFSGQPWDSLDEVGRCFAACAYAAGYSSDLNPNYTYATLDLPSCELTIPTMDADGILQCSGTRTYTPQCPGGRAPLTWRSGARSDGGLADHLDAMATMEAVSITAFDELAAQLDKLGAPAELLARCRSAARDEARHLALLEQLGGRGPTQLPAPAPAETSALTIALHNAVEGCVSETWAALLARHQSEHATDASTRRAFAVIAEDEARHAQLAWDLHAWLSGLLTPEEAAQVEAGRVAALAKLESLALQQALAIDGEARKQLGLPDARRAGALAREFGRRLAAAA